MDKNSITGEYPDAPYWHQQAIAHLTYVMSTLRADKDADGKETWFDRENNIVFQKDEAVRTLWCSYSIVWQTMEDIFGMSNMEIREVVKDTVCKAIKCDNFEPHVL